MAKHTEGPWKYALNVGPTKALIVETDGSTIVEMRNNTYDSRFAANARLIVAAPEMLEALKDVVNAYQQMFDVMPVAFQTYAGICKSVIAKAEGKEQS